MCESVWHSIMTVIIAVPLTVILTAWAGISAMKLYRFAWKFNRWRKGYYARL